MKKIKETTEQQDFLRHNINVSVDEDHVIALNNMCENINIEKVNNKENNLQGTVNSHDTEDIDNANDENLKVEKSLSVSNNNNSSSNSSPFELGKLNKIVEKNALSKVPAFPGNTENKAIEGNIKKEKIVPKYSSDVEQMKVGNGKLNINCDTIVTNEEEAVDETTADTCKKLESDVLSNLEAAKKHDMKHEKPYQSNNIDVCNKEQPIEINSKGHTNDNNSVTKLHNDFNNKKDNNSLCHGNQSRTSNDSMFSTPEKLCNNILEKKTSVCESSNKIITAEGYVGSSEMHEKFNETKQSKLLKVTRDDDNDKHAHLTDIKVNKEFNKDKLKLVSNCTKIPKKRKLENVKECNKDKLKLVNSSTKIPKKRKLENVSKRNCHEPPSEIEFVINNNKDCAVSIMSSATKDQSNVKEKSKNSLSLKNPIDNKTSSQSISVKTWKKHAKTSPNNTTIASKSISADVN